MINHWTYKVENGNHSGILPGMCRRNVNYYVYATSVTIVGYVKQDMEYWGKKLLF